MKLVLTWKSSCFQDFLESDEQCKLELTDCDLGTFKNVVNYLYTEKIDDKDVSIELLCLAKNLKLNH